MTLTDSLTLDIPSGRQSTLVFDVQVEISLSPGLSFAANQQAPPAGTTFDTATAIWNVGTVGGFVETPYALSLPVAVNLTADSLADLPLEERCLTAKVVRAVPSDTLRRQNDTATACLGQQLLTQGEIILFYPYDCVSDTDYPCTSVDTLELVVALSAGDYLQPEDVIVHIQDPQGRQFDGWHTGDPGLVHRFDIGNLDVPDTWTHFKRAISVPDGVTLPGSFSIRPSTNPAFNFLDPVNAQEGGPFPLSSTFNVEQFVKFGELGTYKVTPAFSFTHKTIDADSDGNKDVFTASGTYTFHVGPISELGVRDAGPSPAVGADRRAYTVTAVNNGPDAAHAVEVTLAGVPDDAEAVASHGSYDPASGVWTIGRLEAAADQRAAGFAEEGPTLTLVTAAGAPITATIENPQEYCVRIKDRTPADLAAYLPINDLECDGGAVPDGYTERSTNYYDHIPGNNQAEIIPWPGVGDGHPDAPASLTVVDTPAGNFLKWEPVERVNRHPVTHYQIQELLGQDWRQVADGVAGTIHLVEDYASGMPQYRVRAVNWMGVGGPWSKPTAAQEGERVQADDPVQPPDPTTGLTADTGDGYVDLKWRAHRSDGREIFWQLWRSDDQTWWDDLSPEHGVFPLGLHGYGAGERHGVHLPGAGGHAERVRRPGSRGVLRPGAGHARRAAGATARPDADRPAFGAEHPAGVRPGHGVGGLLRQRRNGVRQGGGPGHRLRPGRRPADVLPSQRL